MREYMGIDQYGQTYHGLEKPRRDLLNKLGASKAAKMYVDTKSGDVKHIGYIIRGLWIRLYIVTPWAKAA